MENVEKTKKIGRLSSQLEQVMDVRENNSMVPCLDFPDDWKVKIQFPFGGVFARFVAKKEETGGRVSVYLDLFEMCGMYGGPYWEAYPVTKDGDTARFKIHESDKLIETVDESLDEGRNIMSEERPEFLQERSNSSG